MQFLIVYAMKLEDIQQAVRHAAESEFKRAFYNACAVLDYDQLMDMFHSLVDEVYKLTETDTAEV